MSHQSMSINQMLQQPTNEKKEDVKSFTAKGSDTHYLCTFDTELNEIKDKKWVNIPLRKCITSVCSSCPDQLMESNTAVYSANFEESSTIDNWSPSKDYRSNVVWEGHGTLSNILNDEHHHAQVTGKISHQSDPSEKYNGFIEVLIQLHPIRQAPSSNVDNSLSLPPVRSIWTENNYSSPPHSAKTDTSPTLNDQPMDQRLPSFSSLPNKEYASDWNSRYSLEQETIKRRKLSASPKVNPIIRKTPNAILPPNSSSARLNTDTYYHQSRRKKRDTKPPNANDIRPFVEVERLPDGTYILPAEVDSWTVLSLGHVVWDKAAFHNQRYIYPVGYRVKKWYRSMVDPHSDTQYTCEILDGGDEPIFQLNADDNPSECWRGPTPTTVWTIAVRRAFAIRNMDYGHNPVGPDFFGLRKNTIAKMIQDLPNADKCKNYIWQHFEVMSHNKGKSVRRSNTRVSTHHPLKNDGSASSDSSVKSEQ